MSEYSEMILGDDTNRRVEGWASVAVLDRQGDIVPIDTIKSAMLKYSSRGGPVLWSHENKIVGKMIQWDVNSDNRVGVPGVHMIVELFKDSKLADDAWKAIKEKRVTGFSIGGVANDIGTAKMTGGKEARVLKDIELNEISLVESPANQMAVLENVSMAKGIESKNDEGKNGMVEESGTVVKAELTDSEKAQLADKLIEWLHLHTQQKEAGLKDDDDGKEGIEMGKGEYIASTEEEAKEFAIQMGKKGFNSSIVSTKKGWLITTSVPVIEPPYKGNMQTIKGNDEVPNKERFISNSVIHVDGSKEMSVKKIIKRDEEDEDYEEKAVTRVKAEEREEEPVGVIASDDDEDEPVMPSSWKARKGKRITKDPDPEPDEEEEEEEKGAEYQMSFARLEKQQDILADGLAMLLKEVRKLKARKAEDEEVEEEKAHEKEELDVDAHEELGEVAEKANYKDTTKPVKYPVPEVDGEKGQTPKVLQSVNPAQDAMVKESKEVMKGANGMDIRVKTNYVEQILLGKAKANRRMV